ncbi:TPA: hypothetical protein ACQZK0_004897 [Enterobacter mori]
MKFCDMFYVVLITALFLLILPGLAAAGGTFLMIYFDALQALPPVATRLGFAAAGMIVVSLIAAPFLNATRSFIKVPALLTFTGIVLLPLQAGLANAFSSPASTKSSAVMKGMQNFLDEIAHVLLLIAPVGLTVIALLLMGGELANLTWKKLRNREKLARDAALDK